MVAGANAERLAEAAAELAGAMEADLFMEIHARSPIEGFYQHATEEEFFNGSLIHGSYPNSSDQFRRSFICHYVGASAKEMTHWYFPLHDMAGNVVEREATTDGGPCGNEAKGPH